MVELVQDVQVQTVRSGFITLGYGRHKDSSAVGYYWSRSTFPADTTAFYLYLGAWSVGPSGSLERHYGFSLRCLQE